MASLHNEPLAEEQYLEIERQAETKSEFHNGQMFALASCSVNHALLSARVGAQLYHQVPAVICGEVQTFGDQMDVVLNPLLIVEVLSTSTEGYERGQKFEMYRTTESFREYLLVHQDRRHVEHYSKQDDCSCVLREHSGAEASVTIARLGVQISLGELYAPALDLD